MKYSISYDLNQPGQDYDKIVKELERLGGKRILYSHWVINRTNTSARNLRTHLKDFLDSNDRLMVIPLDGSPWSGWKLMNSPNDM